MTRGSGSALIPSCARRGRRCESRAAPEGPPAVVAFASPVAPASEPPALVEDRRTASTGGWRRQRLRPRAGTSFAAFTIASTSCCVMSPGRDGSGRSCRTLRHAVGLLDRPAGQQGRGDRSGLGLGRRRPRRCRSHVGSRRARAARRGPSGNPSRIDCAQNDGCGLDDVGGAGHALDRHVSTEVGDAETARSAAPARTRSGRDRAARREGRRARPRPETRGPNPGRGRASARCSDGRGEVLLGHGDLAALPALPDARANTAGRPRLSIESMVVVADQPSRASPAPADSSNAVKRVSELAPRGGGVEGERLREPPLASPARDARAASAAARPSARCRCMRSTRSRSSGR